MRKIKISTRIMLLSGVLGALLVALSVMGLRGMAAEHNTLRSVYEVQLVAIERIGSIQRQFMRSHLLMVNALLKPTPDVLRSAIAEIEANHNAINKTWSAYASTSRTAEESGLAQLFAHDKNKFIKDGLEPILAALRAQDLKEAQRIAGEKTLPLYEQVSQDVAILQEIQFKEAKQGYASAQAAYTSTRKFLIASIAASIFFIAVLSFFAIQGMPEQLTASQQMTFKLVPNMAESDIGESHYPELLATGTYASMTKHTKSSERRGENRAKNVVRPSFSGESKAATTDISSADAPDTLPASKTKSSEWESF